MKKQRNTKKNENNITNVKTKATIDEISCQYNFLMI